MQQRRPRGRAGWSGLTAALCWLSAVGPAHGAPRVAAALDVVVDPALDRVSGTARLRLQPPRALQHVDLWTFPGRLARPHPSLTEVEEPRVFPAGFDAAAQRIVAVADAADRPLRLEPRSPTLTRVHLAAVAPAGEPLELEVRFETRVPHRFGPFGHATGQLTLDGGWFPRPPPWGPGGFDPDAPPDAIDWRLRVRWAGGPGWLVVAGQVEPLDRGPGRTLAGPPVARLALALIPGGHRAELASPHGRVVMIHRRPRRRQGALPDLGGLDTHAQSLATAAVGLRLAGAALGAGRAPGTVTLVEVPLRRDIALAAPGMVLLSDRAFEVTPLERFQKFHRVTLLRAELGVAVLPHLGREPWWRVDQIADLCAEELVARWEARRYGGREGAREVLATGAFVAAVDDILHAPQVPFPRTWFRVVDDTDPLRDRFSLFSHHRTSGRLWRERLRDRAGDAVVASVVDEVLAGRAGFEDALARHAPVDTIAFLEQWAQGPPTLNYRLASVTQVIGPGGPEVEVVIERERGGDLEEPVTLWVLPDDGPAWREAVTVRGPRTTVRLPGTARRVAIDPDLRLVESDLGRPLDPRYDNADFHDWRLLVQGLYFDLSTASARINASLSGLLKRANDPRHTFFLGVYELERQLGASVGYVHGFGPKLRANQLRFGLGGGLAASWLKPTGGLPSGFAVALSASIFDFTYLSRTDPRDGAWLSLEVGPRLAWRPGQLDIGGFLQARATRVIPVAERHTIAAQVRLNSVVGTVPDGTELGLGGFGALRAFGAFAAGGRHRAMLNLEWRHRFTRDLAIDVLHLFWIQGIDGVLFVDAALLGDTAADMGSARSTWLGVGYGIRVHYLVAGFHPMVLSLDLGVPVIAGGRLGPGAEPPVSFVAGLGHAF